MLELLCAASAFAAEAQCPVTGTEQCIMRVDPYFGSTYIMHTVYGHPYFAQPFLPHEARAICRKDKMDQLNHCAVNADFRFVVTSPAEWAGEKFAVNHQRYQPWFDTQNLDQNHEKMGKEYEVVVPGFGSPLGCDPAEWAGRGAQDQIAMTHLFGCWSFRKIHAVQASGQEPAIYMMSGYDSGEELAPFEGSSVGIEHIPSVMGAGALWFMAQELEMKGGERLRGKFELHCPAEAEAFPEREFSDGCPDDRLVGVCNDMPNPEDRLCSKCPLQLKFEGEKVCLYSNRLIPSRKRNFLQATHKPGDNIEVVMIDLNPWEGCSPTDYQHAAVAGKIVAFQFQGCMVSNPGTLAAVRFAEQAGAVGVIVVHRAPSMFMVNGPSFLHQVPVHTIGGMEGPKIMNWFRTKGSPIDGTPLKVLNLQLVDEDEAPAAVIPPPPTTEAPRPVVAADEATFEATPGAVVAIVFIAILALLIPAKILTDRSRAGTKMAGDDVSGIPLSVASMLLSVSLLVIVTVIACSLSAQAAREATDAASANGNRATSDTYDNAVRNVAQLSTQLRVQTMSQAVANLDAFLMKPHMITMAVDQYLKRWDGTWVDFKDRFINGFGLVIDEKNAAIRGWHTAVKTTTNLYADSRWMNDYSFHGEEPALNATNNGLVAGLADTLWEQSEGQSTDGFASENGWKQVSNHWLKDVLHESPLYRVGGELIDPLDAVKGLAPGEDAWRVTSESVPFNSVGDWRMPYLSISLVKPFYNLKGDLAGSITSSAFMTSLHMELKSIQEKDRSLQNVSILVYDEATKNLIGSTHHSSDTDLAVRKDHYFALSKQTPHSLTRKVYESTNLVDNALYQFTASVGAETDADGAPTPRAVQLKTKGQLSGEFDQKEWYSHPDLHALNIGVEGGNAVDLSPEKHVLKLTQGASVVNDPTHGGVMKFDGTGTLEVETILTTDVAYVAATRKGSGAWDSTDEVYKLAMPMPDGRQCIYRNTSFNWFGVACSARGVLDFYVSPEYTVSARIKPAQDVAATDKTQHIFQVTNEGDSWLTLYANGAMTVSTQMGLCVVSGVAVPGGKWTSVVAQFSNHRQRCYVYLDGVLSGVGMQLGGLNAPEEPRPFIIGAGFKGEMEHVRIFHYHADPATLAAAGEYRRKVPSRSWFFDLAKYGEGKPGLDWMTSVRIPRDDVMRNVDANNRYLTVNLKQKEANNQAQLDRNLAETILISAMVVLISVLIFLIFNNLLTGPFADVAGVMCDAAVMRIEEIPESKSLISDLNAMQSAMRLMLANLKEYKSYMPASVIMDDADDESEAEQSVSVATTNQTKATAKGSSKASTKKSMSRTSVSSRSRAQAKKAGGLMAVGLTKKKVSIAIINAVGWLKQVKDMPLHDVCKQHGEMASAILHVFATKKGVPETFSGDRFVCSFNAAKPVGTHKVNATMAVAEVTYNSPNPVSCAVAGGEAKVGNLGTDTMKKFSFVGPLFSWVACMERYAKKIGVSILIDGPTGEDVKTSFLTRQVDQVVYPKLKGEKAITLMQIVKVKEGGESDEWMYELEEAEKADPFHAWNTFASSVFQGNFSAALEIVEKAAAAQSNADVANCPREIFDKLRKAAEQGAWEAQVTDHN